ncbi:hypothetical protein KSP40_PGU015511 [Platanthera guangdongensis]|uniref:Uncharacterized protein n=1 Tax=Platanthera guangdongensis TaxID=2320717 RepID=A0ABR2LUS8_9ASPA
MLHAHKVWFSEHLQEYFRQSKCCQLRFHLNILQAERISSNSVSPIVTALVEHHCASLVPLRLVVQVILGTNRMWVYLYLIPYSFTQKYTKYLIHLRGHGLCNCFHHRISKCTYSTTNLW